MSIHAYKATTCRWASRQQQEQQAYIHFLISLYIEKAARNTGTQHLIFWTKKSKICWVVLDHHHRKKNLSYLQSPNLHFIKVSANHDQTFVENKTAMESSSFFFCAKSIKHVWGVGIKKDNGYRKPPKLLQVCARLHELTELLQMIWYLLL
jgi:hypothetical protein